MVGKAIAAAWTALVAGAKARVEVVMAAKVILPALKMAEAAMAEAAAMARWTAAVAAVVTAAVAAIVAAASEVGLRRAREGEDAAAMGLWVPVTEQPAAVAPMGWAWAVLVTATDAVAQETMMAARLRLPGVSSGSEVVRAEEMIATGTVTARARVRAEMSSATAKAVKALGGV